MTVERRFLTGYELKSTDEPGLVLAEDGTVEQVAAGGARSPLGAGSSPVAIIGPYPLAYTDYNAAAGTPISLSPAFEIGQIVEPFAFFPAFFDGGNPSNEIKLGVRVAENLDNQAVVYDSNAPDNEGSAWGVSGLYDLTGRFPRRALYRIKEAGVTLATSGPTTGFTKGSIVIWAFVWTPA